MNPSSRILALWLFIALLFSACSEESQEPVINHLPDIDSPLEATAYADSLFVLTIEVEDIDGDPVQVSVEGLPAWLSFEEQQRKLSGTPGREDAGIYSLKITADDGKGQRSRFMDIAVRVIYSPQEILDAELSRLYRTATPGLLGVSAAVATPDGALQLATEGNPRPGSSAAVHPNHRYRVASVSKIFTAVLILRLAEEGYLELDGPLDDYVSTFSLQYGEKITIRQMLSHTSGLPDHLNDNSFWADNYPGRVWKAIDMIQYAIQEGMKFEPGNGYAYSNTGFHLLGAVIEKVTNLPLHRAFEEWIFLPLGLEQTLYDDFSNRNNPIDSLAENSRSYEYHLSAAGAAGAIVSTPRDMARFGQAVYGGGFLSESSREQMITDYGYAVGGAHYGLGTRLWDDYGIVHYGHTGSLMDYRSIIMYVPRREICIALATNEPHSNWYDLVNGLLVKIVERYP